MKRLSLLTLCLSGSAVMFGQEKPKQDIFLIDPSLMFPPLSSTANLWTNPQPKPARGPVAISPGFNFSLNGGVCSVPLLEAQVKTTDRSMAVKPTDSSVAIPQAHVPAPSCKK